MKIGMVTGEYPPMQGGVGDYTRELSKALAELGHQVHILAQTGSHAEGLPTSCTLYPRIAHWNWSLAGRLRRWVQETGVQVVNLQYQAAAYNMHPAVNLLAGQLAGAPLVVTFHDLNVPYLFPKAGKLRWWAVRRLAQKATGVIVTNREDQLKLEASRYIRLLAVIPIGSNIARQPPAGYDRVHWREKLKVRPDETLLGYFGFLNESKGGLDLIETIHRLKEEQVPVKLLLIGGRTGSSDPTNAAFADQIDQMIAQLNLTEQIQRTGYVTPAEVSAHLLATDACLMPYRDGISFRRGSFMAALVHGRPIISTTPAVELPELQQRENIFLVPPAQPHAMVEAVKSLRSDQVLREKLAAGADELAQLFRWESIAAATVAFLKNSGIGDRR